MIKSFCRKTVLSLGLLGALGVITSPLEASEKSWGEGDAKGLANTSEENATWTYPIQGEYLIVPDFLTDDALQSLKTGNYQIPSDNYCLLILENNGELERSIKVLSWDDKATTVTVDNKQVTVDLPSGSRVFSTVYQGGDGLWNEVDETLTNEGTILKWLPPFRGLWYILEPLKTGMTPDENGLDMRWKLSVEQEGCIGIEMGSGITHAPSWTAWSAGTGAYFYPFTLTKDHNVKVRVFASKNFKDVKLDPANKPVIYWWDDDDAKLWTVAENVIPERENLTKASPAQAIRTFLGPEITKELSWVKHPHAWARPTCGGTDVIEKIFYNDECEAKRQEIDNTIASVNLFVETIRTQLDNHMAQGAKMLELLEANAPLSQRAAELQKEFKEGIIYYQDLYQEKLPVMQTPDVAAGMLSEIADLADNTTMDAEEREEQCKELGRKIRTIGGAQDDLAALSRTMHRNIRRRANKLLLTEKDPVAREVLEKLRQMAGEELQLRMPHEGR